MKDLHPPAGTDRRRDGAPASPSRQEASWDPFGFRRLSMLLAGIVFLSPSLQADSVRICDGASEWPPFSYFERSGPEGSERRLVGFAVELIGEILRSSGVPYTIDKEMPWARCQSEVLSGDRFQVALQAGISAERAERYHVVGPIYSLRMSYFYDPERFPDGLEIERAADVNRYRICGLNGWDYSYEWIDPASLDASSDSYENMVAKLQRGRCDLFLESGEIVAGLRQLGRGGALGELAHRPLPGVDPDPYYVLLTRHADRSEELRELLEQGIRRMKESGAIEALEQRHLR